MSEPLFLFYEEPDPDRWFTGDRHPRRIIRHLLRGPAQPGGVMRWFLNLRAGFDRLGVEYRINDYRGLRRAPGAWAHVVGKPHVVEKIPAGHPMVYGPGVGSHPFENGFWGRADIRLLLLSCDWFKALYDRDLPVPVRTAVWPAGVDTDLWHPPATPPAANTVLVYDKIRWRRDHYEPALLAPIFKRLHDAGLEVRHLRYGHYREAEYRELLPQVKAMVFLCEHETQGFAYLQALACGVPILAWDRGGEWQDPEYYPARVRFSPVTSVPYFDASCGTRFADAAAFAGAFPAFWENVLAGQYQPRDFVTRNFDLARQAQAYLDLCSAARNSA